MATIPKVTNLLSAEKMPKRAPISAQATTVIGTYDGNSIRAVSIAIGL
jgi:hypothetical protein